MVRLTYSADEIKPFLDLAVEIENKVYKEKYNLRCIDEIKVENVRGL